MNFRLIISVLVAIPIFLSSCESEVDIENISNEIALHPSLVVPIVGASVSLGQIFSTNYNGSKLDFSDSKEINYVSVDSTEFKVPALNFSDNAQSFSKKLYPSPTTVSTFESNSILPAFVSNEYLNLGINSSTSADRIDSLKVNSVTLAFSISVSPEMTGISPSDMKISIIFPTEKLRMLNGNSNTVSFSPTAYGVPVNIVIPNCVLNSSGSASGVPIQLKINAENDDFPLVLTPSSFITCNIVLKELVYSVAYGNFASMTNVSSTLQRTMEINRIFPNGLLKFSNPKISISASSNIGTYLSFQVDYIKAFLSSDPTVAPVYAWFNNHTTNSVIDQFDTKPQVPGLWVSKDFKPFDKDWGETNGLFESIAKPDKIEYKFSAWVNEASLLSDPTPSFITPDANIKVRIKTQIPFQLNKGSYYEYNDTIPNIVESISSTIDSYSNNTVGLTALVLNLKNGFPVKAVLSFKFIDFNGIEVLSDLKKDYTMLAGKVDSQGIVQPGSETSQTLIMSITKAQLEELKKANSIVYSVRIDGENIGSNIHFTQLSTFDLKVGLFVKADLSTNTGPVSQN
jgi:hypothetical protein